MRRGLRQGGYHGHAFPAAPYNWVALVEGVSLVVGPVLPAVSPSAQRGSPAARRSRSRTRATRAVEARGWPVSEPVRTARANASTMTR